MSNSTQIVRQDKKDDIKKAAIIKIKENLLHLSSLFCIHKFNFVNMCDEILFSSDDYFTVNFGPEPITHDELNSFLLTTTSIYSGIFSQQIPFKLKIIQNYHESCVISFNRQQKIISVEFKIILNRGSNKELINLRLNSKFKIINFTWKVIDRHRNCFNHDINYNGFSIPDFIQLLKLKCNANEQINELLPELVIPSAYNMRTEEFKNRLEVVDMILN